MVEHRQVRYAERMRLKGNFRAQLWIPTSDIDLFQQLAAVAREQPLLWPILREKLVALLSEQS